MKNLLKNVPMLFVFGVSAVLFLDSCEPDSNVVNCDETGCLNGGDCINNVCFCPVGYEGAECADLSRDKFLNTYNSSADDCVGPTYTIIVTIKSSSDTAMTIKNLGNFGNNTTVYALVSDENSFEIPSQQVAGLGSVTITGNASLSGTQLSLNYTKTVSGNLTNCIATYISQ